ncbi:MAG: hypothetical protein MJ244_00595 [Clostridia bacterium]|nr:hypothetical protein [Clostridia bacterium]
MGGDVIFNIFLVMTILAAVVFALIIMKDKGMFGGKSNSQANIDANTQAGRVIDEKSLIDQSKLQDLLNIQEIDENSIIHLKRNNGLRVVFSISTPDIYLLNEDEQHVFENALLNIALSLNFPVQFFTTTRKIETRKSSQKILDTINSSDPKVSANLKQYSAMLYEQLLSIEQNRKINEIKNYCVVGVSGIYEDKRAQNELSARIETVVKGFTTAKIKTELLEKDKVLQLLCDLLNRGDNIPIEKLMGEQAFQSRYTTGEMTFQERTIGGNNG